MPIKWRSAISLTFISSATKSLFPEIIMGTFLLLWRHVHSLKKNPSMTPHRAVDLDCNSLLSGYSVLPPFLLLILVPPHLQASLLDILMTTPRLIQTHPSSSANLGRARVHTNQAWTKGLVTLPDQNQGTRVVRRALLLPFHSFHVKGIQLV